MTVLVDTGVLVALIDPDTREHQWAQDWSKRLPQPFLTSEPVLTEAAFVLARDGFDADELFTLAEADVLRIGLRFEDERAALRELMARYRDVPMSLADATLVRLAELNEDARVFTLDADFRIYRRHRSKIIPVLMPDDQTPGSHLAETPLPYRVRRRPAKGAGKPPCSGPSSPADALERLRAQQVVVAGADRVHSSRDRTGQDRQVIRVAQRGSRENRRRVERIGHVLPGPGTAQAVGQPGSLLQPA